MHCSKSVLLKRTESNTLGARGFSCAVSGFGQVLKSDPREKLVARVSSAFGRTRVGLRPTKRSSPSHARKKPLVPRVRVQQIGRGI